MDNINSKLQTIRAFNLTLLIVLFLAYALLSYIINAILFILNFDAGGAY